MSSEGFAYEEEEDERDPLDELIGVSAAWRKVRQQIDLVASSNATVLITGESGTGKELVARAIHAKSPRRHHPIVPSTRRRSLLISSSRSFLDMYGALSREHTETALADLDSPITRRSFWTKSARFPFHCKANCCGCCRRDSMSRSEERRVGKEGRS